MSVIHHSIVRAHISQRFRFKYFPRPPISSTTYCNCGMSSTGTIAPTMTTPSHLPTKIRGLMQLDAQSTKLVLQDDQPMAVADVSKGEHLIKVSTTSPCSGELLWAKNFPGTLDGGKTLVPCYDLGGTVVTAPTDSPFPAGTEIWTRTTAWRTGNAREYTIAVTSELSKKPPTLSWEEAASMPLSGFTAYQALFEKGGLTPGWKSEEARKANASKRVLITAAAGGVGVVTLQLAKAAGIGSIVAQTSTDNVEFVKSLGATEAVNYREQSLGVWADAGAEKADLVLDMLGGKTLEDCWKCVKDDGVLLSIRDSAVATGRPENKKDVRAEFFVMEPYGWQLDEIAVLVGKGEVKPIVDSVWNLEDYARAFSVVEGGHARGKVIIKVQ
jgi:NADPH:quinone reductase-like Zn-dependent oxidoreductase